MKIELYEVELITESKNQLINITEKLRECVLKSGVNNGILYVMSKHTTMAITMNEAFSCVEEDILLHFQRLVPEEGDYIHNHFLPSDGCLAYNAPAHIKSVMMGYFGYAPIVDGRLKIGSRMDFYLVELDGPKTRGYLVQIIGE